MYITSVDDGAAFFYAPNISSGCNAAIAKVLHLWLIRSAVIRMNARV